MCATKRICFAQKYALVNTTKPPHTLPVGYTRRHGIQAKNGLPALHNPQRRGDVKIPNIIDGWEGADIVI
jgi:hypothetical protein